MQTTEIEDRIKIHDLFVRYCSAVDNWDEPALLCCFTEDGVLETPVLGGRFAGRDGQREFVLVGHSRAKGGQMRHFFSNLTVQLDSLRATAQSYFVVYSTKDGKSELSVVGQYKCNPRKLANEWLFEYRGVSVDSRT